MSSPLGTGGPSLEPGSWHCARGIGATGVVSSSLELGVRLPTTSLCPIDVGRPSRGDRGVFYHLTQRSSLPFIPLTVPQRTTCPPLGIIKIGKTRQADPRSTSYVDIKYCPPPRPIATKARYRLRAILRTLTHRPQQRFSCSGARRRAL